MSNRTILENQLVIMGALISILTDMDIKKELKRRMDFTLAQLSAMV